MKRYLINNAYAPQKTQVAATVVAAGQDALDVTVDAVGDQVAAAALDAVDVVVHVVDVDLARGAVLGINGGALAQAALQRDARRFAFVVRPQARLTLRFRRLRGRLQGY